MSSPVPDDEDLEAIMVPDDEELEAICELSELNEQVAQLLEAGRFVEALPLAVRSVKLTKAYRGDSGLLPSPEYTLHSRHGKTNGLGAGCV